MTLRALTLSLALATPLAAQDCTEDAMIVFDGSGSMAEMGFNQLDEPRIVSARRAVAEAVPDIARQRRLGLVVYGPGGGDFCAGIDLRFPPIAEAGPRIVAAVNGLEPAGDTALTEAVTLAAKTLDHRNRPGAIVLVTDGKDTCGGTPCRRAVDLAAEARDLTIHVIGFKVRGAFFAWGSQGASDYTEAETNVRCMAEATGGLFLDTETAEELEAAFRRTLGCHLLF
ncbi:MAG: VWA domain-containing protein [Pseudomonadota bacterium]